MKELTEKQKRMLSSIIAFFQENGRMPSIEELANYLLVSNSSCQDMIGALRKKGALGSDGKISILKSDVYKAGCLRVPLYRTPGEYPDGSSEEKYIPLDVVDQNSKYFSVVIGTEDMLDGGINPGDEALIEDSKVEENDIVLFESEDGKWALRHIVFKSGKIVELWPENYSMGRKATSDVRIYGKLVLLTRRYN